LTRVENGDIIAEPLEKGGDFVLSGCRESGVGKLFRKKRKKHLTKAQRCDRLKKSLSLSVLRNCAARKRLHLAN